MSKNITIAGTNYNNVPSIDIPLQTSGVASFYDISDTTAVAADVATGKYFYTAAGVRTEGTSSGGGGFALPPYLVEGQTVTIGANSITKMDAAKNYFNSYQPYFLLLLKTTPTVNNQVVALWFSGSSSARYRGGTIATAPISSAYDAKLVEGTEYVLLTKTI